METIALTLEIPGFAVPAALTLPDGDVRGAVLLVPGSLYSDVDGNYPTWQSFPRVYAHLAEGLARHGLATLRFAKLGPGTGSQQTDAALAPSSRTWAGRARTARLALALLRNELAARGLGDVKIVVAGHSEGAVVASVLGQHGVDADGLALLSGPSVGILGIMLEQNRAMPNVTDDQLRILDEVIDVIRRGDPITDEIKQRASGPTGAGALVSFPPEGIAYMRDVDATNPLAAIASYDKPVLIVQGGSDLSVPAHHGEALRDARGSLPTTYAFFPELQHFYKEVPAGTPLMENFGYPGPTDPRVDAAIASWMATL
jgi:alpha-beta hydrolase superfamily lysophospholipase